MKREDIAKLSDEEADIKMAQLLGYTDVRRANEPSSLISGIPPKPEHANHRELIPSYCSDPNAMAEVEKTLGDTPEGWDYDSRLSNLAHQGRYATARQRVETFLATMAPGSAIEVKQNLAEDGSEENEGHPGDPSEYGDS